MFDGTYVVYVQILLPYSHWIKYNNIGFMFYVIDQSETQKFYVYHWSIIFSPML